MRREHWPVEAHGIRPAGKSTHCFYCGEPKGGSHAPGCVIRQRTVVVAITVEIVVDVPEDWTEDQVEFLYGGPGSRCKDANVDLLVERARRGGGINCLCDQTSAEFVREATADDEARDGLFVNALPS